MGLILYSCYSFTGASIPDHIKSLHIMSVVDKSGFGNPIFKDDMTVFLIDEFRDENLFDISQMSGDARLEVEIISIKDSPTAVSPGELETERKITVQCKALYYDNVNRKEFWNKNFSAYDLFELSNPQENRNEAVKRVLEQITQDIILAVVSGW